MTATSHGEQTVREARRSPVARFAARSGFVASALVQLLVGAIAIRVALTSSKAEADGSGALAALAHAPGGVLLLWIAGAGAGALTIWLLVSGFLAKGDDRRSRWADRAKSFDRAIVYGAIAVTAVRFAAGAGSSTASASRHGSASLMGSPAGTAFLFAVGAGIVVGGVCVAVIGIRAGFLKLLVEPRGAMGTVTIVLGRIGYVARGLAFCILGVLLGIAAVTADPGQASGLDGALKSMQRLPLGPLLLTIMGAGWIASAAFTVIWAKQVRLD